MLDYIVVSYWLHFYRCIRVKCAVRNLRLGCALMTPTEMHARVATVRSAIYIYMSVIRVAEGGTIYFKPQVCDFQQHTYVGLECIIVSKYIIMYTRIY